ncbi:MAG: MFS transporter [Patescibacteria group bacterium]|jgi:MFS family permease
MFSLNFKNKSNRYRQQITYTMGFILAVSTALPAYIQSSFLAQYINLELTSLFFVINNLITVVAIIFFPRFIKKLSNYFSAQLSIGIHGLALLGLATLTNPALVVISFLLFTVTTNLLWINMDIFLEAASSNNKTGRIRTMYLTLTNIGWILVPIFSAYLVKIGNYTLPFLISAALIVPVFFILLIKKNNLKLSKKYKHEKISKSIKKLWKNHDLRGIFIVATLLQLFYSGAVLYMPLYLNQNLGIPWSDLGWMFAVMLLPFALFEIPAGYLADKYFGEKEIMSIGLFIILVSLILFFFIEGATLWVWAAALFMSRIGAALVESMRDTYFFKNVNADDIGYINLFRITGPLGYIIGSAAALLFLLFLPLNYLFLIFAAIMIPGFYYIGSIKDTK